MIKTKKALKRSGIPVVCFDCRKTVYKFAYTRCSICGGYICPDCEHHHNEKSHKKKSS